MSELQPPLQSTTLQYSASRDQASSQHLSCPRAPHVSPVLVDGACASTLELDPWPHTSTNLRSRSSALDPRSNLTDLEDVLLREEAIAGGHKTACPATGIIIITSDNAKTLEVTRP